MLVKTTLALLPLLLVVSPQDQLREASLRLIARDYQAAIELLAQELAAREADPETAKKGRADRILFLLAGAQLLHGSLDEAAAGFRRLGTDYPASEYVYLARFGLARGLARSRRFQDAAAVYKSEIARLLSPDRRVRLSETYLGLVEKRLSQDPKDYKGAIQFLDLAVGLELPPQKARELAQRAARLSFEAKDYGQAAKRFEKLVRERRGAVFAATGTARDPAWTERLWLARAWRMSRNIAGARRLLENLLREGIPGDDAPRALLELALSYGVPDDASGARRGIDTLERFLQRFPDHDKAVEVAYLLSKTQAKAGRLEDALKTIALLQERYSDTGADELAQAGADRGLYLGRLARWDAAIEAWKQYLSRFPAHGRWLDAQRSIVDLELSRAHAVRQRGKADFDRAANLYREFLRDHPLDARTRSVYLTLGSMEEERERFDEARKIYERTVSKYPGTREASDAAYRIGRLLETKLFNYLEALAAYRKVKGPFAGQAQRRIGILKEKSLTLETERVFRTDEKARIKVRSRNIPELRVRVYDLALETFFRATLGRGNIESLAVEVISPDHSFVSRVEDYVAHKETEREIEIPFERAGAFVVKVDDAEYEASSLVLVSDLALISKSSRRELFVFAQNTRGNRPEPGAEVFVTDGNRVIAEGVTGSGGSYRFRGKAIENATNLHVFARTKDGSAATTLRLGDLRIAPGLVAKSFLYTDRSVYKPGETCAVKAIIRDVERGTYAVPAAADYRLDWIDARGRVLASRELQTGDFGTVAAKLDVPVQASPGRFSLRLRREKDGRVLATSSVEVAEFTTPRVSLSFESEHSILVRGERIEGKVKARYFFGGPVAGKRIEVATEIDGDRRLVGTTDRAGEFPFSFDTGTLRAGAGVTVTATIPEEQAAVSEVFLIRNTEFRLGLQTPSGVYLVGDDLEAEVTVTAHDGKPLARKVSVALYRLRKQSGAVQEIPVLRREVDSDAQTGRVFAHFEVAEGGDHRLRAFSQDRFGNRIETRRDLFVSGDKDKVKLRVLSKVQHGKVGDQVELRVVNRVGPKLCLACVEGDGVLEFEPRVFPPGETKVELRLREIHAPNFAWTLSMPDDKALHQARREFLVKVPLEVEVVPAVKQLAPGGKLGLEVLARNGRGEPVEAELSIAIVDQAILEIFPDKSPDLYDVFYGPKIRRVTNLRTAGSTTFSYHGTTRRVNQELKAEEKRREREEAEKRALQDWASGDEFVLGRGLGRERVRVDRDKAVAGEPVADRKQRQSWNDVVGLGGGAGGKFSGRSGGRRRAGSEGGPAGARARLGQIKQSFELYGAQYAQKDAQILSMDLEHSALGLANKNAAPVPDSGGAGAARIAADPAVWRAVVRTDRQGRAKLELEMPRRDGSWTIRARGVTKATLVGEHTAAVVTSQELILKPQIPLTLTEGDEPRVRVEVHNLTERQTGVAWEVEHDQGKVSGRIDVPGTGSVERRFPYTAKTPGRHEFRAKAESDAGAQDEVRLDVNVQPWSIEERAARSGLLSGEATVRLRLPEGRDYRARRLVIGLGPDIADELLPIRPVSRRARLTCSYLDWIAPTHANRAATGLAALALRAHWVKGSPKDKGALAGLDARIGGTIAELQSIEAKGEVPWIGRQGRGSRDAKSTLLAALFLVRAKGAGFPVDDRVLQRFHDRTDEILRRRDLDMATLAFLVTAEDKRADFTRFNTLYRARQRLGVGAKGRLALGAFAMSRPGLAADLVVDLRGTLGRQITDGREEGGASRKTRPVDPSLEAPLWALLALDRAGGNEDLVRAGERWVHARRRPWGFASALVTALAVEFLAERKLAPENVATRVEVEVNGKFRRAIDFAGDRSHREIVVDPRVLEDGDNRVTLRTSGRGSVVWSALLSGLTRGLPQDRIGSRHLVRTYLQPPSVLDGVVLPEGFGSVDSRLERWRNVATQVAAGGHVRVELDYRPTSELRTRVGSFVLEEPLPAGTLVLPSEVTGNYDHMEVGRGFLRFFVHASRGRLRASYKLRGVVPGRYRILPTRVFSLEDRALGIYGASAELKVLPAGEESTDTRRATPDELFARGTRLFDRLEKSDLERDAPGRDAAERYLAALLDQFREHLREKQFREAARRLLRIHLAKKDHAKIVLMFEALKDRDEDYVLSFEDMAKVGEAYYSTGEFERALVVYRAIAETSFLREVQIAGTLDRIGELRASIDFMRALFLSFPGVPTVRGAIYSLAQSLNRKARELEGSGRFDPKVGTPLELKRLARNLCYEFLLRHPDDGDADEVLFTLASVALEAQQLDEALRLLARAQKAYGESEWLDDFLYLEGYAHFLKGEPDEALKRLVRVAEGTFPVGAGRRGRSDSRWLATFLMGQIHHAAGRPGKALVEYGKVERRFPDAKEAADFFRDKRLALPEVTVVKPGESSKIEIALRNLKSVDLAVYKVDLMRLYLMRKSLSDMGKVQLFGIAPVHQRTLELSSGEDFEDHEQSVELPLSEAGAYLVLARSGELTSSGLLLRTDLEIEAQELVGQGRIRVNVKQADRFLARATVKVVGDRDGKIRTGKTDQRGVFIADALQGRATVLARVGDSYAFYRGKAHFGPPPEPDAAKRKSPQQKGQMRYRGAFDALQDNALRNLRLQDERQQQLESLYKNAQRGVEIRRAK